jgi:hypothetical protein
MTYGITFTDSRMTISADKCVNSMKANNVQVTRIHGPKSIAPDFVHMNSDIFKAERGAGYWLWKPYIIYNTLLGLQDGDILIYSDAGVEFLNNVNYIIERMTQDVFLFGNKWRHGDWCKKDTMYGGLSFVDCGGGRQVQASVIFLRNSAFSRKFIKQWLLWCQLPGQIDDSPSVIPNDSTFQDHRHDQAILTCLLYMYAMMPHWWPASYNNGAFIYDKQGYETDSYPVMFNHHRLRNDQY